MYKIYILIGFLFLTILSNAQIKLEKTYTNSVSYTDISDGEYVIYDMDVTTSRCNIYDTSHNLIKTVPISLDADYSLYDIKYVSRYTFNSNDDIELVYTSYTYVDNVTTPYYQYTTGVVDENGNSLLKVSGGMYFDLQTSLGQNKLIVWVYDNNVWPYFKETHIYAAEQSQSTGIVLEKKYSNSVSFVEISSGEEKLMLMDVNNSICKLYNTDYTLFKSIYIPLETDYYLYDIKYVSRNVFNDDSSIEVLYMSNKYFDADIPYYQYSTGVVDENGQNLLTVPGGAYYDIQAVNDEQKLLVWIYDNSTYPYFKETQIYALNAPMTVGEESSALKSLNKQCSIYPNPATEQVSINYSLPAGETAAKLSVFNAAGQLILQKPLRRNSRQVTINIKRYSPGLYNYTITLHNKHIVTHNKFIIK